MISLNSGGITINPCTGNCWNLGYYLPNQ